MRTPKLRGYFAVEGDDGKPVVVHATIGSEPEGAVAISDEQAAAIGASRDSETLRSEKQRSLTRDEVREIASVVSADSVARLAADLMKMTGGTDADQ